MLQNQPLVTVTGKHNCETKLSYLYFIIKLYPSLFFKAEWALHHNCPQSLIMKQQQLYLYSTLIYGDMKNTIKYGKYYAKQLVKTFFYEQPVRHCMCYDWVGLPAI